MIKNKFKYIAVVYGGTSGERAVSLESGRACIKALKKEIQSHSFWSKNKKFKFIK